MQEEKWLPVIGYEGYYEVSDLGRVRSLDRLRKNKKGFAKIKGRIIKTSINPDGYEQLVLQLDGKRNTTCVHKLVAESFLNYVKSKNMVIDHINNLGTDNRLCNLQIISVSLNNRKDKKKNTKYHWVIFDKSTNKWRFSFKACGLKFITKRFGTDLEAYLCGINILKNNGLDFLLKELNECNYESNNK